MDGSEVDVRTESVQRDNAVLVAFGARDFGAGETARAEGAASFGTRFTHTGEGFLHRGTEGGTVFELAGDPLGDESRIEVRVLDLDDVETDFVLGLLGDFG